jgi:hypothetical protein
MDREHGADSCRQRQAGGYPPVSMDEIGACIHFLPCTAPECTPQSQQRSPTSRAAKRGLYRARVCERFRSGGRIANPPDTHTVEHVCASLPRMTRRHDPHVDSLPKQSGCQAPQERAGNIAWPSRIVMGEEDDAHLTWMLGLRGRSDTKPRIVRRHEPVRAVLARTHPPAVPSQGGPDRLGDRERPAREPRAKGG